MGGPIGPYSFRLCPSGGDKRGTSAFDSTRNAMRQRGIPMRRRRQCRAGGTVRITRRGARGWPRRVERGSIREHRDQSRDRRFRYLSARSCDKQDARARREAHVRADHARVSTLSLEDPHQGDALRALHAGNTGGRGVTAHRDTVQKNGPERVCSGPFSFQQAENRGTVT